jgi:hypothetical protein
VRITIIGAAVLNIFEHVVEHYPTEVRWLLTVALVIVLLSIAALVHTIQSSNEHKHMHRVGSKTMVVSAILISVLGFVDLRPNFGAYLPGNSDLCADLSRIRSLVANNRSVN